MISVCSNCRFWSTQTRDVYDEDAVDLYVEGPHHKCLRIVHGNGDDRNVRNWPAMVCDGSGYAATMWTLPTFSCALFERRVPCPE